jgi:ribosomal protein S4E
MAQEANSQQQKVMVAQTGKVLEINFRDGMTIADAIKEANIAVDKTSEVRVNGKKVKDLKTAIKPNDQVMVVGQIRGA